MHFLCYTVLSLYLLQISSVKSEKTTDLKVPDVTLATGGKMPAVGLGTWQALDSELETALELALKAGYRHIDTANVYRNEKVIGRVLKRWFDTGKLKRSDIFLVTKFPPGNEASKVEMYMNMSLQNLQVDYVDVYLIHSPHGVTDLVSLWKAMEKQVDAKRTKTIGLSNFNITQIQKILDNSRIRPVNLQNQLHLYNQENELVDFCTKENIIVTAYSPIGAPGFIKRKGSLKPENADLLGNPTVKAIAKKHNKTAAQVLLRFTTQRGIVVIPKSTNADRLKQNLNIFDFILDEQDLKQLKELNRDFKLL